MLVTLALPGTLMLAPLFFVPLLVKFPRRHTQIKQSTELVDGNTICHFSIW